MSDMQKIRAIMQPLPKATVADVMAQLEALLEALPPEPKDDTDARVRHDTDARLRHDIEVLLAGYKAGAPRQRPKPQTAD